MNLFSLPKLSPRAELLAKTLHHLTPLVDHSTTFSRQIFQQDAMIQPYFDHPFYSCTRYGFNFPHLPSPLQYLNISAILGTTGLLCYDQDELQHTPPRKNATVFMSTAFESSALLQHYALDGDEVVHTSNKMLFGRELLIEGHYPEFELKAHFQGIELQFKIDVSRQSSWMMKTPLYDDLSLVMHYEGFFHIQGERYPVSGTGTFEFARAATPHSLLPHPLSLADKVPVNFVTYQIINLDDQSQLILSKIDVAAKSMSYKAYIRHKSGLCEVYDNVEFSIVEYQDKPTLSPFGQYTLLPKSFEWKIFNQNQEPYLMIKAKISSTFQYGVGLGYAAAFEFEAIDHLYSCHRYGQGYLEYIDVVEQTEICPYPDAISGLTQPQQSIPII